MVTKEDLEKQLRFREQEMRKKLTELYYRLDNLSIKLGEKFDIFKVYFSGMQDGFFIGLRSLGIEPSTRPLKEYPADQRPPIEKRIDYIINQVESDEFIESAWYEIGDEFTPFKTK